MLNSGKENDRSIVIGEGALSQIKGRKLSAVPRNYELWYTYVSGYHTELSHALNSLIESTSTVPQTELDAIYDRFLSPQKAADRVDQLGTRILDEIQAVMSTITSASENTTSYSKELSGAEKALKSVATSPELAPILQGLISATRRAEEANQALEARLASSRVEIQTLQTSLDSVRMESLVDPLTGLQNRKSYDDGIAKAMKAARENNTPMALIVSDIDHFKKFNDTFGHLTGDQVLRLVAMAVKQNVKGQDLACRVGGEEFAVILPDTTLRDAITVGEHIRRSVMTKELVKRSTGENLGRITISLGVASLRPSDTAASLYDRADQCLYAAKRSGRNRVICETDPEVMASRTAVA